MNKYLLLAVIFLFSNSALGGIKDKLGIGININSQKLYGNHNTGTFEFGGNPVNIRLNMTNKLFIDSELGFTQTKVAVSGGMLKTDIMNFGFKFGYRFLSENRFNPLLYFGFGGLSYRNITGNRVFDGYGAIGAGAEFFVSNNFGLNLTSDYRYTSGDDFDGVVGGKGKDAFFNIGFGLNYYFGGRNNHEYDAYANLMLQEMTPVEQLDSADSFKTTDEENKIDSEQYAMLSFKRNQLLYSLEQREKEIKILQAKLGTLNEHANELQEKLEIAGLMGTNTEPEKSKERNSNLIHYRNALVLFQAGYHNHAIESFNALLRDNPDNSLACNWWYWLGESQYNIANYNAAVKSFKTAVETMGASPKSEMARLMLGMSLLKAGESTEAQNEFESLIKDNPVGRYADIANEMLAELQLN